MRKRKKKAGEKINEEEINQLEKQGRQKGI
jgi:hypothetical protein